MNERLRGFGWRSRFRCNEKDVLEAFHATGQGIRATLRTLESGAESTPSLAGEIAGRLREQRELVRQIILRKHWERAKHLLRLNARLRERFLRLISQADMPADPYIRMCKVFGGSVPMA